MNLQQVDRVDEATQILESLRDLTIILRHPTIGGVPVSVFTLMEVGLEKAISLLLESIGEEVKTMEGGT